MGDTTGTAAEVPGDYVPWLAFVPGAAPGEQSIKAQNRVGGSAEAPGPSPGPAWPATLDCSWGSSTSTGCSRQVDGTTRYLLDGLSVVAQYSAGGQRQAWYTQSLARIDEVLNVANDSGKFWYQADALGSVYGLTNQAGALIGGQSYDVFGAPTPAPAGPAGQPFGFTGREHELDNGLVYARARYLNPAVGRWTAPDPLGFVDGPSVYGYVRQNPANFVDPTGRFLVLTPVTLSLALAGFVFGAFVGAVSATVTSEPFSWVWWQSVILGATWGFVSPLLPFTPGLTAAIGGAVAAALNAIGQAIGNNYAGKRVDDINWVSVLISGLGGVAGALFGVAVGRVFDDVASQMAYLLPFVFAFGMPVEVVAAYAQTMAAVDAAVRDDGPYCLDPAVGH